MIMKRFFLFSIAGLLSSLFLTQKSMAQEATTPKPPESKPTNYEKDIAAWEERDKTQVAGETSILFLGSSSIRRWTTMPTDMAPWPTVGRGYGGAKFSDLVVYAPRLLKAHHPRAVVIYVGNDITGNAQDKKPEEVVRLFSIVVDAVKAQAPKAEIFLIAITPSPSRFKAWPEIQVANHQLNEFCQRDPKLHFIVTHPSYLTADGQPRPELYVQDQLHQNEDGYKKWSGLIRKELERVLGEPIPKGLTQ